MPFVFLLALLSAMLFGDLLPETVEAFFYAVSLAIKEGLIFALPVVIFSLVSTSLCKVSFGSVKLLIVIIPLICCSNFLNTLISYGMGWLYLGGISCAMVVPAKTSVSIVSTSIVPLFSFSLPSLISNEFALSFGIIFGFVSGLLSSNTSSSSGLAVCQQKIFAVLQILVGYFFKVLLPLMPLFIFGTALKLKHDEMISKILSEYLPIMIAFLLFASGYILLQLFLLSNGKWRVGIGYLQNLLPPIVTGFGSMSSAAALPLSIKAAEQNSTNPNNARIIVPCSVNIHLVGDCFFIPFVALSILTTFGEGFPDVAMYLKFSIHFVLAKFAVAAVPGGGILVMLPILQKHLGFSSDMLGLITAQYVLFDSFITGCNVAGNGSLAILFDRIAPLLEKMTYAEKLSKNSS
jgi:Na+/H+-dicarboxylate symporter